jgi:hypothetical protein
LQRQRRSDSIALPLSRESLMDPTLTWLLLIAAAVLIVVGAVRFDLLSITLRNVIGSAHSPPHNAPPSPRRRPVSGLQPHDDAPAHKPAFHRSGRRH